MSPTAQALEALLKLQDIDTGIHSALQRAARLRDSEEIAALIARRGQAVSAARELDERRRQAEQKVQEAERAVAAIQAKIDRDTERLHHGGSAKDLMGIQHEIDTLTEQRGRAEEAQLEAMGELEAQEADRESKLPVLREADERAKTAVADRDRELAELKARHDELTAARPAAVAAVGDAHLVSRYDTLRNARGGGRIGVARFRDATCTGCGSRMSPVDAQQIDATPASEMPQCPQCSALLVR